VVAVLSLVVIFLLLYVAFELDTTNSSKTSNSKCDIKFSSNEEKLSDSEYYLDLEFYTDDNCNPPYKIQYNDPVSSKLESILVNENSFSKKIGPFNYGQENPSVSITDICGWQVSNGLDGLETTFSGDVSLDSKDLKIYIDPVYKEKMLIERNFEPSLPLNPFDEFIVEVKSCSNLGLLPHKASIITNNEQGEQITLLNNGAFIEDHNNLGTYLWKVRTLTEDSAKLELLIESIVEDREVKLILSNPLHDDVLEKEIRMSACVPVYGSGKNKLVSMRGVSAEISPGFLVNKTIENKKLLISIDPFKQYKDEISYYVDLKNYDDSLDYVHMELPSSMSICNSQIDEARVYYFYNEKNHHILTSSGTRERGAFFWTGTKSIYLPPEKTPVVALHEGGHAFCGLNDEYPAYISLPKNPRNCVNNPSEEFSYNGVLYGGTEFDGCLKSDKDSTHIPAEVSVMKSLNVNKFNVVSCGYCLSVIKGGSAQSHWAECEQMDTVKV